MVKMNETDLPVIDFAPFMENVGVIVGDKATTAQLEVAAELNKANCELGFHCIKNFAISREQMEECFDATRELFAKSQDEKDSIFHQRYGLEQGYISPTRQEVQTPGFKNVKKEAYLIGDPTEQTYRNCPQRFVTASKQLYNDLLEMRRRYSIAVALALGVDPNEMLAINTDDEICRIRYNHYPPIQDFNTSQKSVRLGSHTDFGTHTFLLLKENACGLQIQPRSSSGETGEWVTTKIPKDVYCVVNTGDMMEVLTGGIWKATRHRVILESEEQAKVDRYSIGLFANPGFHAEIKPFPKLKNRVTGKYSHMKPFVAGPFMVNKLQLVDQNIYEMETKEDA